MPSSSQKLRQQLQKQLNTLSHNPQQFNQISRTCIIQMSKLHNPHNRLLPSFIVADLIEEMSQLKEVFGTNKKVALRFCFLFNLIRLLLLANFNASLEEISGSESGKGRNVSLSENKIFHVMAMIYAEKLSQYVEHLKVEEKSFIILKSTAQFCIVNEIMLKLVQRTKTFFPEYLKALKVTLDRLQASIRRNIKHSEKGHKGPNSSNLKRAKILNSNHNHNTNSGVDINSDGTSLSYLMTSLQEILSLAFSNETQKKELIYYVVGLMSYVLKQAASFVKANSNKKEYLALGIMKEQIIEQVNNLKENYLPQHLAGYLVLPSEFKKYTGQGDEEKMKMDEQEEPIFLEEPIKVRELTPRFYNEEEETQTKLLRKKRNKLRKKMEQQLKSSTQIRLQEQRVKDDVKRDKVQRQVRKELFVMQRQTEEAKKVHKQMKKVKGIKKDAKAGSKGGAQQILGRKGKK